MINFNEPPYVGKEKEYINKAIDNKKICGDGEFTKKCHKWLNERTNSNVLLTTSCSHALDMSAILSNIHEGDEVIMPSFTFVSTADAFVLRGAKVVFVDIRPDTMNIDEKLIEEAITEKTKAIVPVHYAGVACEMDTIMDIAKRHNLMVIEDAAQGVMSEYKGQALGTIGDYGCYSFHETKNYSMGEGGAILVKDPRKFGIIEIGARMGGDCIGSDLVQISTGYDYVKMVIDVAVGKAPDFTKVTNPTKATIKFIFTEKDLEEMENFKKENPKKIYRISELDRENIGKTVDSSTRVGYYITTE